MTAPREGGMLSTANPGILAMTRFAAALIAIALGFTPAFATLKPGDHAPDFTAQAALGGQEFTFALADALKKGPVVVYFYPKAFTQGCSLEAHAFADAMPTFAARRYLAPSRRSTNSTTKAKRSTRPTAPRMGWRLLSSPVT